MKLMFLYFVICCSLLELVVCKALTDNNTDPTVICDIAKRTYRSAGYLEEDIYTLKRTESSLRVCGKDRTCCKTQAELNLVKLSEKKRSAIAGPLEGELNTTFHQTGKQLVELLREVIHTSQQDFETWFKKTYGLRYEQNRHVFKNLYNTFHRYINGSELDLETEINGFFAKLHEKVYVMTKPFSSFDKKYENCILESTNYVKPFGIIQEKVQRQLYRSFLASRIFLQGLKEGLDIMTQLLHLPVHNKCSIAYMKMTQCSICSGLSDTMKPCANYCVNVMKGCFAFITLVQPKWNEYVKEMVVLAEKLEGPFSLEAIVEPLAVKISEAIMIFQDNSGNITVKVEERCGKTPTKNGLNKRKRRTLDTSGKDLSEVQSNTEELVKGFTSETEKMLADLNKQANNEKFNIDSLPSTVSFTFNNGKTEKKKQKSKVELLFSNTKSALNNLLDYWVLLPTKICAMGIATDNNTECWNGLNTTGYNKSIVSSSVHDLFTRNPEMDLDPQNPDINIINYAKKLELMIEKARNTIHGNPVVCVDCDGEGIDQESGSGSGDGSGSGSGDFTSTPATTTTENPCENSVDTNCIEVVQTTKRQNEVLNNEVKFDINYQQGRKNANSSASEVSINILLLLGASLIALIRVRN